VPVKPLDMSAAAEQQDATSHDGFIDCQRGERLPNRSPKCGSECRESAA